ncbi:hypothetical protein OKA04_16020 [Luteolibacter flavescens]|uniref:DUF3153 domain-containing protein n=1 Tax=Luteolibacter flavescens TaxID=1859460 RepID=A0ABT3FRP7_9BACT|nr:hypothetical protein [Luteolibacter flavescens]MCW1886245.1 hypothetical protein [Luteolibacter flavescens]
MIAACAMLAACFDVREEVWVEPDGRGRAELRYTVPESALMLGGGAAGLEEKIRTLIARQPSLKLDAVSVTAKDDRAVVAVDVSTDSVLSLRKLKKSDDLKSMPESTADIAGHFDVHVRGLDVDFSRSIHVGEALGLASLVIGGTERKDRRLTYIIHLPKPAKEHNATRTDNAGKTLVWDYTLGEALKQPFTTHFRAAIPLPSYVWFIACGLLLSIAALVIHWGRKLRRRRAAQG